jgi:hypothetical protein
MRRPRAPASINSILFWEGNPMITEETTVEEAATMIARHLIDDERNQR